MRIKNLEKRDDGKFEVLDVKLDNRKTKSLDPKNNKVLENNKVEIVTETDKKNPVNKVAIELNEEIIDKKKINKIIIINGPNLNLLGEREQSQYGSTTYDQLKENCSKKAKEIGLDVEFAQSNVEGELVNIIQDARKKFDGMIINAAAFTHTSVAIRDALDLFKKPIIEIHLSNIYKREEFRHKSLISGVVTGGIFGLGAEGYILAIISLQKTLHNENR